MVELESKSPHEGVPWAQSPPDWQEILTNFRGSELQNYFTRILEDDIKAITKPQYVDNIPKAVRYCLIFTSALVDCRTRQGHLTGRVQHTLNPASAIWRTAS